LHAILLQRQQRNEEIWVFNLLSEGQDHPLRLQTAEGGRKSKNLLHVPVASKEAASFLQNGPAAEDLHGF